MKKTILLLLTAVLLQACSTVDDYMLGKDNTPKPSELTPIEAKIQLKEDWTVPIGNASKTSSYYKLKPVIKGNYIYTADSSGLVQAIDKQSGKVLWTTRLKDRLISGPSIRENYLALGTNSASVIVLRQSDGQQLWQAKVSSDALSKPLIARQNLVVKTIDGNLYAFDLKNGEKRWAVDHGSPNLILKASSSPVMLDKMVLVGFSDGRLDAVDLQTGNVIWQRSIAYAIGASDVERLIDIDADPIVRGSVVYLASYQGYIGALSLSNGEFIWRKPASTYKNLAIDDRNLYMTDSDDVIWAYDRQTGQVKWKQDLLKARGLSEPVLMGNKIFIADRLGVLHGLSKQNGSLIARKELGSAVDIAPTVSSNSIYVMTANGKLSRLSVS